MAETMKLTVDTGAVQVDVEDKDGKKIGEFRFNPMDSNILLRYQKVVEFFNGLSFDKNLPDDQQLEALNDLAASVREQFDYLFGCNVSDGLFANCGPLSATADGDFFFEEVLRKIAALLEQISKKRIDAKLAKVRKATEKYKK